MIVRLVATKMRDYFGCTEIKRPYELFKHVYMAKCLYWDYDDDDDDDGI